MHAGPLFRVALEDAEEEAIIEKSATAAWSTVISKVNNLKTEETGKRQFTSVSGPEYFGFGVPAVAKLIQGTNQIQENTMLLFTNLSLLTFTAATELPNADSCTKYEMQLYSEPSSSSKRERESSLPSFKPTDWQEDGSRAGFVLPKKKRVLDVHPPAAEAKRRDRWPSSTNSDGEEDRERGVQVSPRDHERSDSRSQDRDRKRTERNRSRDHSERDRYHSSHHASFSQRSSRDKS